MPRGRPSLTKAREAAARAKVDAERAAELDGDDEATGSSLVAQDRERVEAIAHAMREYDSLSREEVLVEVRAIQVMATRKGKYKEALAASKILLDHLPQGQSDGPPVADEEGKPLTHRSVVDLLKERRIRSGAIEAPQESEG